MDKEGLSTEEQMAGLSNNDATHIIAKGKRTKRLRLLSPACGGATATTVMTSSCSSANSGDGDYGSFSSTTTTTYESTDQEEEDMANCLILLAQGGGGADSRPHLHQKEQGENHDHDDGDGNNKTEKGSSSTSNRKFAEMATATNTNTNPDTNTKVGFFIYECKTCNRTFPSFQALGGHRASHKKPKLMAEEKKPPPSPPPPLRSSQPQVIVNYDRFEEAGRQPHGPPISLQLGGHSNRAFYGKKAKIHECSICGSEFTSGQALGGHMRRHRASTSTTTQVGGTVGGIETSCNRTTEPVAKATVEVQPRNILELDLNLPAPEEDLREPKFQFTATQKSMVLSAAPALVDCHY